jgi:long-chain acyl-CoA synthetase
MWGTEVRRSDGPVPFLVYEPRPRRVTELLDDAARWAGRDHLVQGIRRVTFGQLAAAADRVAGQLRERGLRAGDRLLLLAGNSPEWVITLWAALRVGAVVAPGNRWWSAEEISHAVALVRPAVIVADPGMTEFLPNGSDATLLLTDDIRGWAEPGADPPRLPAVPGGEKDPALIIFTAGTTGLAKAAVLAHRSVIANLHNLLLVSNRLPHQLDPGRRPEVMLLSGPLFHIGGVQALLLALLGGNTVVFLDGRFDPAQVLDVIERERVTVWGAVPTMVTRVLEDPSLPGRDLSGVRSISLGGSPVTPELTERLRAAFPSVRRGVSTVYGMTEAGGTVAAASGAMMADHPQTSGRPMPVVELRIEAQDDTPGTSTPAPVGNPDATNTGEIVVRTPSQMLGYWAEAAPGTIDADGWLHTGDLGYIDDGLLYVTGRAKDVIIRGGENIAAAHVEEVLHHHPAVAAVAVVGLPDPDFGEIVGAVVQPRGPVTVAELTDFAAASLGRFQVPARWWLYPDPLPMTDAGKADKRTLRAAWLAVGSAAESPGSAAVLPGSVVVAPGSSDAPPAV